MNSEAMPNLSLNFHCLFNLRHMLSLSQILRLAGVRSSVATTGAV